VEEFISRGLQMRQLPISLAFLTEEVTITDPGAPDDERLEYICQENQRDTQHLIGQASRP
jgi:hypothetical protein